MADENKTNDTSADRGTSPSVSAGSQQQKLTKVTLKEDHQHAGEKYKAGATIEVNEADAKWLRDNKVI